MRRDYARLRLGSAYFAIFDIPMRFLKVWIFILLFWNTKAQQLHFSNISADMSMPSQVCYNIMQDSKGYIWFSTEAGLCRYDGKNIKVFDKKNGLPEKSVYCVKEDEKGKLWFATSKNRILNYYNDTLYEAPFSKNYAADKLSLTYILNLYEGKVYINSQHKTFIGDEKGLSPVFKPDSSLHFYLIKKKNQLITVNGDRHQTLKMLAIRSEKGYVKIGVEENNLRKEIQIPYSKTVYPNWRVLTTCTEKYSFFSFENKLIRLDSNMNYKVFELPNAIIALYIDKSEGLWVGTRKKGLYHYNDLNNMDKVMINLNDYSVSGICEDSEQGIWCSTLEKGIFYSRNKNILTYSNLTGFDKMAELLKYESGKVFVSVIDNELVEFDKGIKNIYYPGSTERVAIVDILKNNKGWIVVTKKAITKNNESLKKTDAIKTKGSVFYDGANKVCKADGRIFAITHGVLLEITEFLSIKHIISEPGKCLLYEGNNNLLYGTNEGLYRLNLVSYECKKLPKITTTVTGILKTKAGHIWVCTKGEGVFLVENNEIRNMNATIKTSSDIFFDITEDVYGTIWCGTNAGLLRVKKGKTDYSTTLYTLWNGLPANEIYKLAVDSSNVYLSTVEGLCSFPVSAPPVNATPPYVYQNTFFVNDKAREYKDRMEFAHNENSIKITFDILTFKNKTTKLIYALNENDTDTIEGNTLEFDNLTPGTYQISVHALNNDGIKSSKAIDLQFEIKKPFWKKAWFIFSVGLLVALSIYVTVRLIIRRIRANEEEKTKVNKLIAESKLTALQAQMNPHFIFNAINSIQRYVLQKDQQQAYDYLAKFSKLIRMVLNQSDEKTITLKDELQMLKLYVELEQLRFDNTFDYLVSIDPMVNEDTFSVPCMLVQPYVENAIWHGLMNLDKNTKGVLKIDIRLNDDLLKITIEDNGIGRKLAQTYKTENSNRSVGMKLTEQRLHIINTLKDYENAKVTVSDLHDEEQIACGTRVEIYVPVN